MTRRPPPTTPAARPRRRAQRPRSPGALALILCLCLPPAPAQGDPPPPAGDAAPGTLWRAWLEGVWEDEDGAQHTIVFNPSTGTLKVLAVDASGQALDVSQVRWEDGRLRWTTLDADGLSERFEARALTRDVLRATRASDRDEAPAPLTLQRVADPQRAWAPKGPRPPLAPEPVGPNAWVGRWRHTASGTEHRVEPDPLGGLRVLSARKPIGGVRLVVLHSRWLDGRLTWTLIDPAEPARTLTFEINHARDLAPHGSWHEALDGVAQPPQDLTLEPAPH